MFGKIDLEIWESHTTLCFQERKHISQQVLNRLLFSFSLLYHSHDCILPNALVVALTLMRWYQEVGLWR